MGMTREESERERMKILRNIGNMFVFIVIVVILFILLGRTEGVR